MKKARLAVVVLCIFGCGYLLGAHLPMEGKIAAVPVAIASDSCSADDIIQSAGCRFHGETTFTQNYAFAPSQTRKVQLYALTLKLKDNYHFDQMVRHTDNLLELFLKKY